MDRCVAARWLGEGLARVCTRQYGEGRRSQWSLYISTLTCSDRGYIDMRKYLDPPSRPNSAVDGQPGRSKQTSSACLSCAWLVTDRPAGAERSRAAGTPRGPRNRPVKPTARAGPQPRHTESAALPQDGADTHRHCSASPDAAGGPGPHAAARPLRCVDVKRMCVKGCHAQ